MLDKEFDQIFRDRLLDHPSRVRHGLWKQVHTHLVRHTAFWKWYFVGPSAIAVAVTSYFLVATLRSPSSAKHSSPAAAVATYKTPANSGSTAATPGVRVPNAASASPQPLTSQPSTAPSSSIPATASGSGSNATPNPNATPGTNATPGASAAPGSRANPRASATGSPSTIVTPGAVATIHLSDRAHRTNQQLSKPAANHHRRSGSGADRLTNTAAPGASRVTGSGSISPASAGINIANTTAAGPPIPAQLTAPARLAALKTRPAVAAITPNPKDLRRLILPARPLRKMPHVRLDVFGAPEYFTLSTFSLSYGAGVRATFIYKNHWTLTSGLQYLRIGIPGTTKDSLQYLPPGNIKNLHLPILIGYTTGNDRFTFSANAGVLLSLYAHAAGKVTETGWYWPNRNGLNAYLGLSFSSHVTDKVSIFAEPYLKCWYPPYMHFPSRAWSTGIMVGVRFNF